MQTPPPGRETSDAAPPVRRRILRTQTALRPQLRLAGASPLVQATGRGALLIERHDVPGERQQINRDGRQLKGKFYDLAAANKALGPGGIYSAKFKSSQIVCQVDAHAKPGTTPIVGRLVRMD